VGEDCDVDVFESMGASPVPSVRGMLLFRASSASGSIRDDSPSIVEHKFPLFLTGILHIPMFLQVSVSPWKGRLAPSNGGLTRQAF